MKRRRILNALRRALTESPLLLRVDARLLAAATVIGWLSSRADRHQRTALLLSPGGHNIGDQALYESAISQAGADVLVIAPVSTGYDHEGARRCAVGAPQILTLTGLVHRTGGRPFVDAFRFARTLRSCSRFLVVGADVMDGGYTARVSVRLWTLAGAVSRLGLETRILGFSWNSSPAPFVDVAARRAVKHGVTPCLRDPISLDRFMPIASNGRLTADIVFGATAAEVDTTHADLVADLRRSFGKVALVNVSGLVADHTPQASEYQEIVAALRRHRYAVVFLPHVASRSNNDNHAIDDVMATLVAEDGISRISVLLSPPQIRGLAQQADLVISGRMHLAVLSMMQGVPAIVLNTQGKVEGLMSMFALPELAVHSGPGFGAAVAQLVDEIVGNEARYRTLVSAGTDRARNLAAKNFE